MYAEKTQLPFGSWVFVFLPCDITHNHHKNTALGLSGCGGCRSLLQLRPKGIFMQDDPELKQKVVQFIRRYHSAPANNCQEFFSVSKWQDLIQSGTGIFCPEMDIIESLQELSFHSTVIDGELMYPVQVLS